MKINKKNIVRWKVYFDRARVYVSSIQFMLIGIVFIKSIGGKLSDLFFRYALVTVPVFIIIFICFAVIVGYLDLKLGIRSEEFRNLSESNPVLTDILKKVNDIQRELLKKHKKQ
jgi:hypothetical protein